MAVYCNGFDEAISALGAEGASLFDRVTDNDRKNIYEARIRMGAPPDIVVPSGIITAGTKAVTRELMNEMVLNLCGHSVYTHQQEMASGYIPVPGGHRAGVCGLAVNENGRVSAVRNVTSICLRIAKDHRGCSAELEKALLDSGMCSAVIAGAPCSGKTTLLRDLACRLSEGGCAGRMRVSVVDERGELSMLSAGEESSRIMRTCDVLRGYPKAEGIRQAVRSMSPDVIVCDELGSDSDVDAALSAVNSGVSIICSVHAGSLHELMHRPQSERICSAGGFGKFVLLSGRNLPGRIERIISSEELYESGGCGSGHRLFGACRSGEEGQTEKTLGAA